MNCNECKQPLEERRWCNNCDVYKFLEESKTIRYNKKLNILSKREKFRFKIYEICPNCKEIKDDGECIECDISYSECNKCKRPNFTSEEE